MNEETKTRMVKIAIGIIIVVWMVAFIRLLYGLLNFFGCVNKNLREI